MHCKLKPNSVRLNSCHPNTPDPYLALSIRCNSGTGLVLALFEFQILPPVMFPRLLGSSKGEDFVPFLSGHTGDLHTRFWEAEGVVFVVVHKPTLARLAGNRPWIDPRGFRFAVTFTWAA